MRYIILYPFILILFLSQRRSRWVITISLIFLVLLIKRFLYTSEVGYIRYYQGLIVDNIREAFLILSVWVVLISIYAIRYSYKRRRRRVILSFILSLIFLLFFFSTRNIIIFFIFFELSLIPVFYLISYWRAQYERVLSNYYFILFTIISSVPLFLIACHGFIDRELRYYNLLLSSIRRWLNIRGLVIIGVLLGFISKLPVYRLHIWLPKAHVDAPVRGSMVLAGILLKLRRYRVIRLLRGFRSFEFIIGCLGLFRAWRYICSALICIRLVDYKVIVAFSSVSHISVRFAGLLAYIGWRFTRAFYVILRHRVLSPLIFYIGNVIYYRTRTRNISGVKRRASLWRVFSVLFLFVFIINFRFPPFINFFREVGLFYVIILISIFAILLVFVGFLITRVYLLNIYVVIFKSKSREWWNLPSILNLEYFIFVLILILYTEMSIFLSIV